MSRNRNKDKPSKRQALQAVRKRNERLKSILIWGSIGIGVFAVVGFMLWQSARPVSGEDVPLPADAQSHIPVGTPPGPYSSDPPAGGHHYDTTLPAKFYNESDLSSLPEYPEGYLNHNLEHGYVIFWYNCAALDEAGCTELKKQIQGVMDAFDGVKLIAFPWKSLNNPVVMTSWGKLLRFEKFDSGQARSFVQVNRYHAPEPNAP